MNQEQPRVYLQDVDGKGVKIELNSKITYVDETTIKYEKNNQECVLNDVDTLVFAVGYQPISFTN